MEKFKFKKYYGQNFITNEEIISKIINNCNVDNNTLIVEIGPGAGILTKKLQSLNNQIICYEIDKEAKLFLNRLENEKTTIIYQDFLNSELEKDIDLTKFSNVSFIANIPYYITTPIIKKIMSMTIPIKEIVLMVQEEVANRLTSSVNNKTYGSFTVYLNYYFNTEKLFTVSRKNFKPEPKVDSAVIKLVPKKEKLFLKNEKLFFELIKDAFAQKRKTLKNNLKNYDFSKVLEVLKSNNLNENARAEEISLEIFVKIANILS